MVEAAPEYGSHKLSSEQFHWQGDLERGRAEAAKAEGDDEGYKSRMMEAGTLYLYAFREESPQYHFTRGLYGNWAVASLLKAGEFDMVISAAEEVIEAMGGYIRRDPDNEADMRSMVASARAQLLSQSPEV